MGRSLAISGTIILRLKYHHRTKMTKECFFVIIEDLIHFRNGKKKMVLHVTPYPRKNGKLIGCAFNTKGVLYVIIVVTPIPLFNILALF